jgi:small subunit ribosomal protein S2
MSTYEVDLKELLEAGCHFGHQAKRWNPKMRKFIYTQRDGVHIFDLVQTGKCLEEAMTFVRDSVRAGKEVVFVGAKRQAKAIVREEATKVGAAFVIERWLGGMLTNWDEMDKRIKKLSRLKTQRESGELAKKYTKLEQTRINKEIERLERFFGGISGLSKRPDILFIVDTHREKTAAYEASKLGVSVVGMLDSNADPDMVDYPIPLNDDAIRSIKLVVEKIAQAYADGKQMRAKEQPKQAASVPAEHAQSEVKPGAASQAQPVAAKPASAQKSEPAAQAKAEPARVKKVVKKATTKKKAVKKKAVPAKKK